MLSIDFDRSKVGSWDLIFGGHLWGAKLVVVGADCSVWWWWWWYFSGLLGSGVVVCV